MHYLTKATDIQALISRFVSAKILWLDTEVADWNTNNPKVSLIQVLAEPEDLIGDRIYIIDVLNKPELVTYFVNQIMANPRIEKVFHNASYDLRFLGKEQAQNVTCTLKIANKIPKASLQVPNLKLKTLAIELCNFSNVDKEEQGSNWGRRPLTEKQLQYAKMDTVYLAQVHRHLLKITNYTSSTSVGNILDAENPSLSVTKVRVAFECPRLFYLKHCFGGNTLFLPPDTSNGIGNAFHNLAAQFVNLAQQEPKFIALFKPAAAQLKVEDVASQMQQLFYELTFFPYLQATVQKDSSKAPALLQLWQGLKDLIRRWAELLVINRRYCSAEAVIRNTFVSQERSIAHYFDLPDGTQQRVVGEFDSLIFNFELQRLCVVEFKTYQPVDTSAQLAQVALYSYMLWVKSKKPIDAAVYCVLPKFKEHYFSWEQLAETVHQLIPHKLKQMRQWLSWKPPQSNPPPPTTQPYLCEICPQQQKCQSFFELAGEPSTPTQSPSAPQQVSSQTAASKDVEPRQPLVKHQKPNTQKQVELPNPDAEVLGKQLVETLQSFKISVDYLGAVVGSAFIRVKLKPSPGVKFASILNRTDDLKV